MFQLAHSLLLAQLPATIGLRGLLPLSCNIDRPGDRLGNLQQHVAFVAGVDGAIRAWSEQDEAG